MAFPPRRKYGLGERLPDILANTASFGERAEAVVFGGEGTATDEEVRSSLTYVTGDVGAVLPPPSDVIMVDQAQSARVVRTGKTKGMSYARPDLDPSAYGQGSAKSTRVWAMQWIPTMVMSPEPPTEDNGSREQYLEGYGFELMDDSGVYGDILVAFARPSRSQKSSLYIFKSNTRLAWDSFSSSSSLGRAVRLLNGGTPFDDGHANFYRDLHPDFPDSDWIFSSSYMGMWSTPPGRAVDRGYSVLSTGFLEEFEKRFD